MASPIRVALRNLVERIDEDLLPLAYKTASLTTPEIQAELEAAGLPWYGAPDQPAVHLQALEAASDQLIRHAARGATVRGAVAGAGGLLAVVPDSAASAIQTLHLAQRLAVVWGHDPDHDRGRLPMANALAAAYQIELPAQGQIDLRVRDLPAIVARSRPTRTTPATAQLARALATRAAVTFTQRLGRVVPGLGAGVSAVSARRGIRQQGQRMVDCYRRTWRGELFSHSPVTDAVEVKS